MSWLRQLPGLCQAVQRMPMAQLPQVSGCFLDIRTLNSPNKVTNNTHIGRGHLSVTTAAVSTAQLPSQPASAVAAVAG